ncbi:hypothetical protein ACFQ51_01710 [Streptomyces kaempferi]
MSGSRQARWGLALQAAGTCLLAVAVVLEVTDQPLPSELALSLAAATPFLGAAPLYTAGRRTWMVVVAPSRSCSRWPAWSASPSNRC